MKQLHSVAMFHYVDVLNGRLTFILQTYNVSGRLWANNSTASFSSSCIKTGETRIIRTSKRTKSFKASAANKI